MGRAQIFSRPDVEAYQSLQAYRLSLGLPAFAPLRRPEKTSQMGEWVDSLAYEKLGKPWDLFVTGTFRPIVRRWRNPCGLAAMETSLGEHSKTLDRNIEARDLIISLVSHSPSQQFVQGFFYAWIKDLSQELGSRIDFFVGFEAGALSGANHFHALLAGHNLRNYSEKGYGITCTRRQAEHGFFPSTPDAALVGISLQHTSAKSNSAGTFRLGITP